MAIRYAFGVVLGLVTTFVLFMIMQSVIKSDRNPFTDAFDGKSRIERHRLIYGALGGLMKTDIHALKINAFSPAER